MVPERRKRKDVAKVQAAIMRAALAEVGPNPVYSGAVRDGPEHKQWFAQMRDWFRHNKPHPDLKAPK